MSDVSPGEPTIVGAAWRFRAIVVAAVLLFIGGAVVYAETRPPAYTASASMAVQDPRNSPLFGATGGQASDRYVGDQITVLKSPQLAAIAAGIAAAKDPPLPLTTNDFISHTTVTGSPLNGSVVQIAFTGVDEAAALGGVDAIKTAYQRTVHDAVNAQLSGLLSQVDAGLASITTQLSDVSSQLAAGGGAARQPALAQQQAALITRRDALTTKRDQILVDASAGSTGVSLYLPPRLATHTSHLVTSLPVIAVAALLGLVAGVVAAYMLASRRRVFRSREEVGLLLDATLVSEIPRFARSTPLPAAGGGGASPAAAAFRSAALFVQASQPSATGDLPRLRSRSEPPKLVVASANRREGRSTLAANLGIALADSGLSTLLIDADPSSGGLSRLLRSHFEVTAADDPVAVRRTRAAKDAPAPPMASGVASTAPIPGMSLERVVMPGRPPGRLALLRAVPEAVSSEHADRDKRIQDLEAGFNVVVIDAPPVADMGPQWRLLRRAGGALLVVADNTPVADVEELARMLAVLEMRALGYVYNRRPRSRMKLRARRAVRAATAEPSPPRAPEADLTASA